MSDGEIVAIPPAKIKEGGRRRTMQKVATILSHSLVYSKEFWTAMPVYCRFGLDLVLAQKTSFKT